MADTPTPIGDVQEQLRHAGYLADTQTGTVVHLAQALSKPVLIEGPAGTGKTQLAKSVAAMTGKPLIRLQCYEGLDESKAIYEWDYRRQLLQLQLQQGGSNSELSAAGIFGEDFLLSLAAAGRDPVRAARRAAHRRGGPAGHGGRGAAARGPLGVPGLDP